MKGCRTVLMGGSLGFIVWVLTVDEMAGWWLNIEYNADPLFDNLLLELAMR